MIEPKSQQLSISRQCKILDVNRSSYYYRPKPIKQEDLDLMRKIDELYLENPSSGSRTIRRQLKRQGMIVSRKRIQRLMRLMGIEAVYPKPNTSRPHPQHKVYPYLLRDLTINRPNQVWASRYNLHPDGSWVHVSCGDHGLAQPQGFILASLQHHGAGLLYQCPRRGPEPLWST